MHCQSLRTDFPILSVSTMVSDNATSLIQPSSTCSLIQPSSTCSLVISSTKHSKTPDTTSTVHHSSPQTLLLCIRNLAPTRVPSSSPESVVMRCVRYILGIRFATRKGIQCIHPYQSLTCFTSLTKFYCPDSVATTPKMVISPLGENASLTTMRSSTKPTPGLSTPYPTDRSSRWRSCTRSQQLNSSCSGLWM